MQLYARIRKICEHFNVSQKRLAESLGLRQPQLNGYLNAKSQKNLWQYLPQILLLFPKVSREWLYFGEGGMLLQETSCTGTPSKDFALFCRSMPLLGFSDSINPHMNQVKELSKNNVAMSLSKACLAVKVSGNGLFPAGIQHGHICYCNPEATPVIDEPVFAMNKLKQGFLKVYLGEGRKEGLSLIHI